MHYDFTNPSILGHILLVYLRIISSDQVIFLLDLEIVLIEKNDNIALDMLYKFSKCKENDRFGTAWGLDGL